MAVTIPKYKYQMIATDLLGLPKVLDTQGSAGYQLVQVILVPSSIGVNPKLETVWEIPA